MQQLQPLVGMGENVQAVLQVMPQVMLQVTVQ